MKSFSKFIAATAIAIVASVMSANAAPIIFKGNGLNAIPLANPVGNWVQNCGTRGADYCSVDHDVGLQYMASNLQFAVKAYVGNTATRVIQDIRPPESGLGAFSETNSWQDQTETNSNESIEFIFQKEVVLTNIEFNSGADKDCSAVTQPEGPCGNFDLFIDGVFHANIAAVDWLTTVFIGTSFKFVPTTIGGGFAIAQIDARAVPIPAALPLLLTGLAGLGFASRRRKKAA